MVCALKRTAVEVHNVVMHDRESCFRATYVAIIQYDAGRLYPKVFVNCRVQGTYCSFRIFSYGPLPDYCMSVPRWWELAQFTGQKCDSVCTDWMKVVDCIVLSGAHLLAVTSLSDSPTASTQRGCETLPVVWTVSHSAQCIPTYYMCGCTFTAHAVCPAHLWDSTFWLL